MLLYIHIPFCDSKCHYCSFNSYVDKFDRKGTYMESLVRQLHHDLQTYEISKHSIETLFIGGGTPSTIDPALFEPLFEMVNPFLQNGAEITSEANPNSASRRWLSGMHDLGVNRISFGVQSFFDDKLRLLGRAHKAKEAMAAVERAAALGFDNISIDIIYATMLDTPDRIEKELGTAFELPISHLSAYELTIEEGTPFQQRPEVRKESVEASRLIREYCVQAGFNQYEISNYGKPCRHNLGYWQYKPYLGVGSGAAGRIGHKRYYPHTTIEHYIDAPFHKDFEPLQASDMVEERLLLGLRSDVGVDRNILETPMQERADLLTEEGKLLLSGSRYCNPDFLLSDEIALFILG